MVVSPATKSYAQFIVGKRPARFKWSRRIGIALVVYSIVGFFIVPPIIKSQMLKRLPALTKRQAAVRQVKFNPWTLSLTIRGFSLKEPDGEVFASFDEFYVNFEMWASLFKWSWVFKDISLNKPFAQVSYQEDGTFNFANLFDNAAPPPPKPEKPPGALPPVRIYHLSITNGAVAIADLKHKPQFRTEFIPIDLNLTNLATLRDVNSPYSFVARTDSGETFAWSGTVGVTPPRSTGSFRLGGLKLGKYSAYSHDYAKFEIVNGTLDIAADYRLSLAPGGQDLDVSNAAVYLTNLQLKDPTTGEMVVTVPSFSVTQAEASVAKQTARAGLVKSTGGSFLVRRNHNGTINLLSLVVLTPKSAEQVNQVVQTVIPWTAGADEISIEDYAIKVEDKVPDSAAGFAVDQINLNLKGVSDMPNAKATVALSVRFQETGNISVNGTATFIPPSADLDLALTNVDLRPITPYVGEQAKLLITDGAEDLRGHLRFMGNKPGEPMASFTGDLAMKKFITADDVLFKEFTKWDSLAVSGIKLDVQPDRLAIAEVKFTGLNTSLIRGPDGRFNVQTILRNRLGVTNTGAATTNAAAARTNAGALTTTATNAVPDVSLGALVLKNASLHFADESLEPHCSFEVQELDGSIKGLSSREQTPAVVDFKGRMDERSPFSVTGKVSPLGTNLFADVNVNFTNMDLTAFTPYAEKYVGRPLQKGKFSMGVHYLVNGKALKAENDFYIDQLTLGAKNNSTNATKMPVKLAIALLKDRNGRIQLDIPLTGRVDDPKFKVGPLIWHVVENLLVKVATSPFSLLGAMFGGGDEMSFVQFGPGHADIPSSETNKLETLAKSLYARPTLSLEINGSVDPATDRLPLARVKLEDQMKSLWVKERTESGKPAIAIENVNLEPREHERLLRKIYKQTIGRYKPTEVSTNQSGSSNSVAAMLAALPPPVRSYHGSVYLVEPGKKDEIAPKPAGGAVSIAKPAKPLTRDELELADMEDQLVRRIEITNDDLRDLMKARAASVQAYLLKTEKVTPDRLFIIAPKPIDAAFKGEDRANLSLD